MCIQLTNHETPPWKYVRKINPLIILLIGSKNIWYTCRKVKVLFIFSFFLFPNVEKDYNRYLFESFRWSPLHCLLLTKLPITANCFFTLSNFGKLLLSNLNFPIHGLLLMSFFGNNLSIGVNIYLWGYSWALLWLLDLDFSVGHENIREDYFKKHIL